jgi:hypothetical protein
METNVALAEKIVVKPNCRRARMFRCATASGWENVTYDGNLKSYADSRIADQRRDCSAVSPLLAIAAKARNLQRSPVLVQRDFAAQRWRKPMPRGDKSKYTDKQERKAEHIEKSYEGRGVPEKEAERRAWATVNKDDGGGKRAGGSGRGKSTGHPAA